MLETVSDFGLVSLRHLRRTVTMLTVVAASLVADGPAAAANANELAQLSQGSTSSAYTIVKSEAKATTI